MVLDHGRVIQVGSPSDVYERPANLAAAACTGHTSTLTALVEGDGDGFWLVHPSFRRRAWRRSLAGYVGTFVIVAVRPTWVTLAADGPVRAEVTELDLVTGSTRWRSARYATDLVEIATAVKHHHRGEQVAFGSTSWRSSIRSPVTSSRDRRPAPRAVSSVPRVGTPLCA